MIPDADMVTSATEVPNHHAGRTRSRLFTAVPAFVRVSWRYVLRNLRTSACLLAADVTGITLSHFLASVFFESSSVLLVPANFLSWALFCVTTALFFLTLRLYPAIALHPVVEMKRCITGTSAAVAALSVWTLAARWPAPGRALALAFVYGCVALPLVPLCRSLVRGVCSRFGWWGQRAIVVGTGRGRADLLYSLEAWRARGLHLVGVVDHASSCWDGSGGESLPYLGPLEELTELAWQHHAFWALVPLPVERSGRNLWSVRRYVGTLPHVVYVPASLGRVPGLWTEAMECGGEACLVVGRPTQLSQWMKRGLDLGLLLGLAPALVVAAGLIALAIKLSSPGPVFYTHERVGRGGRRFRAWKFRTMVLHADEILREYLDRRPELRAEWEASHKLKQDPRVTRLGYWLRRTSLDELPQAWNILRGEMSLVGPRPIVSAEIPKYGEHFASYASVLPGVTGLWQISGRNNTTYDVRVCLDAYYAANWSLWLDLYILARTVKVALTQEGAY
mgnify:CR=1 FL=1